MATPSQGQHQPKRQLPGDAEPRFDLSRKGVRQRQRCGDYMNEYSQFTLFLGAAGWEATREQLQANPPRRYTDYFPETYAVTKGNAGTAARLDQIADEVRRLSRGPMTLREFADLNNEVVDLIAGKDKGAGLRIADDKIPELEAKRPKTSLHL